MKPCFIRIPSFSVLSQELEFMLHVLYFLTQLLVLELQNSRWTEHLFVFSCILVNFYYWPNRLPAKFFDRYFHTTCERIKQWDLQSLCTSNRHMSAKSRYKQWNSLILWYLENLVCFDFETYVHDFGIPFNMVCFLILSSCSAKAVHK